MREGGEMIREEEERKFISDREKFPLLSPQPL